MAEESLTCAALFARLEANLERYREILADKLRERKKQFRQYAMTNLDPTGLADPNGTIDGLTLGELVDLFEAYLDAVLPQVGVDAAEALLEVAYPSDLQSDLPNP